ncbi:17042_t:CDS:1, partial [Dentiscutata erythropus]
SSIQAINIVALEVTKVEIVITVVGVITGEFHCFWYYLSHSLK